MEFSKVKGFCHLVANELNGRLDGEVVGVYTASGKIWHYGFRLPDGRVLCNESGVHSSTESFKRAANKRYGRNFEIRRAKIAKESVEIFDSKEKEKVSSFVDTFIEKALS